MPPINASCHTMRISLLALCLLGPAALPAAETTGPFSFADPSARIPAGAQDGIAEITLKSSKDQTGPPVLKDSDLPHPPAATIGFELVKEEKPQANVWRYQVHVSGLLPANANQQHYAIVYEDNKEVQTISYLVTNTAPNFSWTISKLPEPWVASGWLPTPVCTEFTVTPKDYPATGVVLGASTLIEQNTKTGIDVGNLQLCLDDADGCKLGKDINLTANVPSHLKICTTEGFHGNFHGIVTLASAQKPDGDTVLQSVSFSSFIAKCAGLFLICVGIYLAWWSKVWARARLERDQASIPAIVMRAQLAALQQILSRLPPAYLSASSTLSTLIQDLLDELSDSVLDSHQFLPPKFPSPYGYAVDAAGYKAYLEARNAKVLLFSVLVKEGVVRAAGEDNGNMTSAQQALVVSAIKTIASLGTNVPLPSPDQGFQLVQPIITKLHNDLFPQPAPAPAATGTSTAPAPPASEFETLQLQVQSISKGIWLLYGALTAFSGLGVLILNNPGFGIPVDFIFAFFWGFGLPTTIGALAPGSAASALNISVAKT